MDIEFRHDIPPVPRINYTYRLCKPERGFRYTGSGIHMKTAGDITEVHCTVELMFHGYRVDC